MHDLHCSSLALVCPTHIPCAALNWVPTDKIQSMNRGMARRWTPLDVMVFLWWRMWQVQIQWRGCVSFGRLNLNCKHCKDATTACNLGGTDLSICSSVFVCRYKGMTSLGKMTQGKICSSFSKDWPAHSTTQSLFFCSALMNLQPVKERWRMEPQRKRSDGGQHHWHIKNIEKSSFMTIDNNMGIDPPSVRGERKHLEILENVDKDLSSYSSALGHKSKTIDKLADVFAFLPLVTRLSSTEINH